MEPVQGLTSQMTAVMGSDCASVDVAPCIASISVVIPAYNAERSIRRAVDSVLAQTQPPIEVTVVDDGSSDRTLEILHSYKDQINVIAKENGGPAEARNVGARISSGDWIAFLDADDWWESNKLERQFASVQQTPNAVASYTSLRMQYSDGTEVIKDAADPKSLWPRLRVVNPGIVPSCLMVRRDAFETLGGFQKAQKGCEDWDLVFRLHALGPLSCLREPLTRYVVSDKTLSSDADKMYQDFLRLTQQTLLNGLSGWQRFVWKRRMVSFQKYKAGLTARDANDWHKEFSYMLGSVIEWPTPFWEFIRIKALAVTLLRRA